MNLADALVSKHFSNNERIIKQGRENELTHQKRLNLYTIILFTILGDVADGMYFIEDGNVVVKMDQDGKEIEISRLGKGQYFGELALVTHRPRAASVYADGDVKVACK